MAIVQNVATQHSQKCCETLVAAGAIKTLLKLIRSVSRSIPDQEVLKHALSTLRNLARYPDLAQVLIDADGSLELIVSEFLRNKEEGYYIASQLLKKLFLTPKGIQTIRSLPALLKRLHNLVDDLKRRVIMEKRNPRSLPGKDHNERRLKEASELLKLITNS
ncbi:Armadillo [Macleaya cordata]|uniref:Armadillo n=1 Tax=Macleaya cordata TaxID=56857 RepID=A0A200Q6H9_MACCD|nr:Armadillo [Macleaya cordata]